MCRLTGFAWMVTRAAPSDQATLGLIGAGGRGTFGMTVFQKDPAVQVGAICYVYEPNLERGLSTAHFIGVFSINYAAVK